MWSNALLLFFLSLIPFTTAWMGEGVGALAPTVAYGVMLISAAFSYTILQKIIIAQNPKDSLVVKGFNSDLKGKLSVFLYIIAIALAFVNPFISYILYTAIAVMWIIPRHIID